MISSRFSWLQVSQQILMITAQFISAVNTEVEVTKELISLYECLCENNYRKEYFQIGENTNSVQPEMKSAKEHCK